MTGFHGPLSMHPKLNNTAGVPALNDLLRQHHSILTDAGVKQLDFHAQVSVNVVNNVKTIR